MLQKFSSGPYRCGHQFPYPSLRSATCTVFASRSLYCGWLHFSSELQRESSQLDTTLLLTKAVELVGNAETKQVGPSESRLRISRF